MFSEYKQERYLLQQNGMDDKKPLTVGHHHTLLLRSSRMFYRWKSQNNLQHHNQVFFQFYKRLKEYFQRQAVRKHENRLI